MRVGDRFPPGGSEGGAGGEPSRGWRRKRLADGGKVPRLIRGQTEAVERRLRERVVRQLLPRPAVQPFSDAAAFLSYSLICSSAALAADRTAGALSRRRRCSAPLAGRASAPTAPNASAARVRIPGSESLSACIAA